MRAVCRIRKDPHYRRFAFEAGLEAVGFQLVNALPAPAGPDDWLVIWNRMGQDQQDADNWERNKGTVIVAENGYIGRDDQARQLYAISVHGHCGSGTYPIGDEDRFGSLGITLAPWAGDAGHILVCGQRGLGSRTMASPAVWEDRTVQALKKAGHTNIKLRRHPGRFQAPTTLEQDLDGAKACVIWSSASGVRALTLGVPVVYCAPHWVCALAAGRGLEHVAKPPRDDATRRDALHTMSHGQWTVAEIEAGIPFARILETLAP